jgi:L-lactate dehydrogenase complex protein LldE
VKGLTLVEADRCESCCGFGGTFSIKYADVSNALVSRKTDAFLATSADVVLGGDLGCLMNIAGKLSREGSPVEVRHVAEVLAGLTEDAPPIGGIT